METDTRESRINPHSYKPHEFGPYYNLIDQEIYFGEIRSVVQDGNDRIFLSLATDFGIITIQVR